MTDLLMLIEWDGEYFKIVYHHPDVWESRINVGVAEKEKDAQEQRYRVTDKKKLILYDDLLWSACQEYNANKRSDLERHRKTAESILRRNNMRENTQKG